MKTLLNLNNHAAAEELRMILTQTGEEVDETLTLLRLLIVGTSLVALLLILGRHIDVSRLSFFCTSMTSAKSTNLNNLYLNDSRSSKSKQFVCAIELTRQLAPTEEGLKNENCTSEVIWSINFSAFSVREHLDSHDGRSSNKCLTKSIGVGPETRQSSANRISLSMARISASA